MNETTTMNALDSMTWDKWKNLSEYKREQIRDYAGLSAQLKQWIGYRVEVVDKYGNTRRFIVGQSTGWKPCTLEINNRRSAGGMPADESYKSVRVLYKA